MTWTATASMKKLTNYGVGWIQYSLMPDLKRLNKICTIERVALKMIVQEIITEHKRLFITNGVFPVISIDDKFIVATDVKWLKIVIGQFITNAVKYTFEQGKKIHLTATSTEQGILLTDSR